MTMLLHDRRGILSVCFTSLTILDLLYGEVVEARNLV